MKNGVESTIALAADVDLQVTAFFRW
jgi:hypothetical protein